MKTFLLVALPWLVPGATPGAPVYTADSIANAAANLAGYYAPNTFLSIYGQELSYVTQAIQADEVQAGILPTILPGTGVHVLINNAPAAIYFVSPAQVNVLVPASMDLGPVTLQLVRDSFAGPPIVIHLAAAAPAFFQTGAGMIIATHADGSLVTNSVPARRGEIVVLWAGGLGATDPPAVTGRLVSMSAPLARLSDFRVWLNGVSVDSLAIKYAGATQGFAGLFQINLQIPADAPGNPEVRMGFGEVQSPAGKLLPVQ